MNNLPNIPKNIFLLPLLVALFFITGIVAARAMDHSKMQPGYTKTINQYSIPDITLINQDGIQIQLRKHLATDKTVVLEFIFATCTTICPILSINFTSLQKSLTHELAQVRMVSISIDPEHDTPAILKQYLQKYNAKPGWDFFTGKTEDVVRVMKAFDANVSDKMGHRPLIFLHAPGTETWVRLDGLMSSKQLQHEYHDLKK